MRLVYEHSAGVVPYRLVPGLGPSYLLIYSARVCNPRARWEFPKGGIERGESPREAAAREFREETGLIHWAFREGFEASFSYVYLRDRQRRSKTVTYFLAEVFDDSNLLRSGEHVEDPEGHWYVWGQAAWVLPLLSHAKGRQLLRLADSWVRRSGASIDSHWQSANG